MWETELSKMEDIVHILKKLYNCFENCSRKQVLRTILYLVNINSWNISREQELLNLLIGKLMKIVNKIYDIVDDNYLSRNGEVKDMIHELIDDYSEKLNLEKFVPQPKEIFSREDVLKEKPKNCLCCESDRIEYWDETEEEIIFKCLKCKRLMPVPFDRRQFHVYIDDYHIWWQHFSDHNIPIQIAPIAHVKLYLFI